MVIFRRHTRAMQGQKGFIRGFRQDRRGNMAIMFGLTAPLIVGAVGLGVETGYWYLLDRQIQTAADLAAYAATVEKRGGASLEMLTATAHTELAEQGFDATLGTVTVNSPPLSGAFRDARSVEVILTLPVERLFSALFVDDDLTLTARGVAHYEEGGSACILSLNREAMGGVKFAGSAQMNMTGCNVMSNSLHERAVVVSGAAQVQVSCALAVGGIDATDGLSLASCPQPMTQAAPAVDPFAGLAEPAVAGSCKNFPNGNGNASLTPGRYCGGANLKGQVSLAPGIYVIDGGTLRISANASLAGAGVTLFLTNNAKLDINGSASIDLAAPTSGPYKGLVFWSDADNAPDIVKFNGSATSKLTGTIYLPSGVADFVGSFSGTDGCMHVVAQAVAFSGDTTIQSDCTAHGMSGIALPGRVLLVE